MKNFPEIFPNSASFGIDWLRFSVPIAHFPRVCSYLLFSGLNWEESTRYNQSYGAYLTEGVWIGSTALPELLLDGSFQPHADKFIVDFSGNGLALYAEKFFMTPLDLIRFFVSLDGSTFGKEDGVRALRVDLAFDDFAGFLRFKRIHKAIAQGLLVTRWRSLRWLSSYSTDNEEKGMTLYLGSRSSDSFCRIYDKRLEVIAKATNRGETVSAESLPSHWVRLELEFSDDHASAVVRSLVDSSYPAQTALSILRKLMDFKRPSGDTNISRRLPISWWAKFTQEVERFPMRVPRPRRSLYDSQRWLSRSVAPSLAMVVDFQEELGNSPCVYFEALLADGRLRQSSAHRVKLSDALHDHGV